VMEQHLGRPLGPDEVVHHRNGVKDDNRLENLEVLSGRQQHTGVHNRARRAYPWSRCYPACVQCGTTERPHTAQGLCKYCYMRQFREQRRGTSPAPPPAD
jgi:hypothetical protein